MARTTSGRPAIAGSPSWSSSLLRRQQKSEKRSATERQSTRPVVASTSSLRARVGGRPEKNSRSKSGGAVRLRFAPVDHTIRPWHAAARPAAWPARADGADCGPPDHAAVDCPLR